MFKVNAKMLSSTHFSISLTQLVVEDYTTYVYKDCSTWPILLRPVLRACSDTAEMESVQIQELDKKERKSLLLCG